MGFKPIKKITRIWLALLLSIPNFYVILVMAYQKMESLPKIIENILFGLPLGFIYYLFLAYTYPLSLIFGNGDGKPFAGDSGFLFPSTMGVALAVLVFYLVLFYCLFSLNIWQRDDS